MEQGKTYGCYARKYLKIKTNWKAVLHVKLLPITSATDKQ